MSWTQRVSLTLALALIVVACSASPFEAPLSTTPTSTAPPTSVSLDGQSTSTTVAATATTTSEAADAQQADLLLRNGRIVTVDAEFTIAEALVISGGVITGVGTDEEMATAIGPDTVVVDLQGRTVMPGIVDPHTHHMQLVAPDQGAMLAAQDYMLSVGTTTSGAPSVRPDQLAAFEALDDQGALTQRVHVYLNHNGVCDEREDTGLFAGRTFTQDPSLRLAVAGVKLFADGGTCNGFAISEPFRDTAPQNLKDRGFHDHGSLYLTAAEVSDVASAVDAAGGITVVHAIGDVAVSEALRGLEAAYEAKPFVHHQRIDHNSFTQLLTPAQLSTYGRLHMTPVVFPQPWGNGCSEETAGVWESILPEDFYESVEDTAALRDANPDMRIAWHGDAPNLPGDPFHLMFTLVAAGAIDLETGDACYPDWWTGWHTVDVEEAIRMLTINAAAAMGIGDAVGSIEVGKVGDVLVLANDILGTDPEIAVAHNSVIATLVDGSTAFCVGEMCNLLNPSPAPVSGDCVPPPDGVQSWWPGDTGGDDLIGDNHGSFLDRTRVDRGYVGDALRMDLSSMALSEQPYLADGFTIEGWVYVEAATFDRGNNLFNNNQFFLRKNLPAEGGGFAAFVKLSDGSVEPRAQSATAAVPEKWTHVGVTWDQRTLNLYVDGQLSGSSARAGTLVSETVEPRVGSGEQTDVDGNDFSGLLDELTIYDRPLEPSEIASIHAAGSAGKCKG